MLIKKILLKQQHAVNRSKGCIWGLLLVHHYSMWACYEGTCHPVQQLMFLIVLDNNGISFARVWLYMPYFSLNITTHYMSGYLASSHL